MKTKSFAMLGLLTLALAAPARAADSRGASAPTGVTSMPRSSGVPHGTSLGSAADEKRYLAREVASPDAKKFRGGDVIVITATTVVIILLIVLIIVLI